jgi:hypothetical protein
VAGTPSSAKALPTQTPNTSAPIAVFGGEDVEGLYDSTGKPVTGRLQHLMAYVTPSWRYLFGTFVVRTAAVNATYSDTAAAAYNQAQLQKLIDQVAALSRVVGQ